MTKLVPCTVLSKQALEELYAQVTLDDLHREHIDHLTFASLANPALIAVLQVLDCWFESGAMPYAQLHYPFENETLFDQGFSC